MAESITFEYNGATFTVKQATIGSGIRRDWLIASTQGAPLERWLFSRAVSQTTIEGDPGWQPPEPGADGASVQAAFETWLELPSELGDRWLNAVDRINQPSAAPEFQPEVSQGADPE